MSSTFQLQVNEWMRDSAGPEFTKNREERNRRFLEESLELVQSLGYTNTEAHQLVDHVFNRQPGKPYQECGEVLITLAALATAASFDMFNCGILELKAVWSKLEQVRANQQHRPQHLPIAI